MFSQLVGAGEEFEGVCFLEERVLWGVVVHPKEVGEVETSLDFIMREVDAVAFLSFEGWVFADPLDRLRGERDMLSWFVATLRFHV